MRSSLYYVLGFFRCFRSLLIVVLDWIIIIVVKNSWSLFTKNKCIEVAWSSFVPNMLGQILNSISLKNPACKTFLFYRSQEFNRLNSAGTRLRKSLLILNMQYTIMTKAILTSRMKRHWYLFIEVEWLQYFPA